MRKPSISEALIGGIFVIIAALIGIYPSLRSRQPGGVIAGIVVEEDDNHGIGQASIVIAGRDEKYLTDDTGNFRIEISSDVPRTLRIHVSKNGFHTLDTTVGLPAENLVWQLRKQ